MDMMNSAMDDMSLIIYQSIDLIDSLADDMVATEVCVCVCLSEACLGGRSERWNGMGGVAMYNYVTTDVGLSVCVM